jgi:hypothetical protein
MMSSRSWDDDVTTDLAAARRGASEREGGAALVVRRRDRAPATRLSEHHIMASIVLSWRHAHGAVTIARSWRHHLAEHRLAEADPRAVRQPTHLV